MQLHDVMNVEVGKFNTCYGKVADIMNPTRDMIDVRDIARGLANVCRFGGQIPQHYSVAHHSLYVAALAPDDLTMEALIHDASEAYLGDIIKPLKLIIGKVYSDIEEKWMRIICECFGVKYERLELVKKYDLLALQYEFDHFFKGAGRHDLKCIMAYTEAYETFLYTIYNHFPNHKINQ